MRKTKEEYNKKYYEKHREKILNCGKINCSCGSIVAKYHLSRHNKTAKHLNKINAIKT